MSRKSMKQAILLEPNADLMIQDVPMPTCPENGVLVRLAVATVCTQTDLAIIAGTHPPHDAAVLGGMLPHDLRVRLGQPPEPWADQYPQWRFDGSCFPAPMGHEAAGTVVELGPNANDPALLTFEDQPLSVGDRVATFKVLGGYAQYTAMASHNVVRIPDSMSFDEGSLFEPLIINFNCLSRCWAIREPNTVAVLGQGCQGLLATQVARSLGARRILVSEPVAEKRALALQIGADVALDPSAGNIVHEVERLTDGVGADLVVECVGSASTVRSLPFLVRRGGIVAQLGAITSNATFDYGYVHFKHFIVVPSDYFRTLREVRSQVASVLGHVASGTIRLEPLISHRYRLPDLPDVFTRLRAGASGFIKIAVDID